MPVQINIAASVTAVLITALCFFVWNMRTSVDVQAMAARLAKACLTLITQINSNYKNNLRNFIAFY